MRAAYSIVFVVTGAWLLGCDGSNYEQATCGKTYFPRPWNVLSSGSLDQLEYYTLKTGKRPGDPSYDIWADKKFEFDTSLAYRYEQEGTSNEFCLRSVTLNVRHPVDTVGMMKARDFLGHFEGHLQARVDTIRAALDAQSEAMRPFEAVTQPAGRLVAEVRGIHTPNRGDFVSLVFYDVVYHQSLTEATQ
ncbi:MAG: hypothetical protein HOH43_11680 [Candidatus Latescibacteria bacterium]|nr:hypothetical protein [Candidatus Latescibacterota bacterium]